MRFVAHGLTASLGSAMMRRGLIYAGSSVAAALLPILIMPVLTRALGPEQYGLVGVYIAITTVLATIVGFNSQAILSVRFHQMERRAFAELVGACVLVSLSSTAMLTAIMVGFAERMEAAFGLQTKWQWTILLAAWGQMVVSTTLAVLQIRGRALAFGMTQIAYIGLSAGLSVGLVLLFGMGWEGRGIGHAVGLAVIGLVGLAGLRISGFLRFTIARPPLHAVLAFGIPLIPHSLSMLALVNIDRLAVADVISVEVAGFYFVAVQIASGVLLLGRAVNQAIIPWIFARMAEGTISARRSVAKLNFAAAAMILTVALILILMAEPLVRLLAGDGFEPAVSMVPPLVGAAAMIAISYLLSNYIFHSERTVNLSIATTLAAVVQLALVWFLAAEYGALSVAYATFGIIFGYVLTLGILVRYRLQQNIPESS